MSRFVEISNGTLTATIEAEGKEICGANILYAEAGTTGKRGGDAGHGCASYFLILDRGGTCLDMGIQKPDDSGNGGFYFSVYGDSELDTLIEALDFISDTLKTQRAERSE